MKVDGLFKICWIVVCVVGCWFGSEEKGCNNKILSCKVYSFGCKSERK